MTRIGDLVKEDIEQRMAKGRETYGADLTAETPIDPLQYAYEEALDLAIYLRMELEKRT